MSSSASPRVVSVQRFHSALQPGRRLTLAGSNVVAFSYQGSWDGGCALHSAALGISMLGHTLDPLHLTWRRGGAEAQFWKRAGPYYLAGITLDDLATLIGELNWGLRPAVFEGPHAEVIGFCEREIARGWPVILSWRKRRGSQHHAVLAIGIEGKQTGRVFNAQTLLVVDPSEAEPWLTVYNARLTWTGPELPKRAAHALYVTASQRQTVLVAGAVSIRKTLAASGRKRKAP